jgi:hypothetical protein
MAGRGGNAQPWQTGADMIEFRSLLCMLSKNNRHRKTSDHLIHADPIAGSVGAPGGPPIQQVI